MVQGEAWLASNAAMCACALLLGGKLAGLTAPAPHRLYTASLLGGVGALLALWLSPLAMLLCLPVGVWLCFGKNGFQACLRCLSTTFGASLLSGGAVTMLLNLGTSPMLALLCGAALSLFTYLLVTLIPSALRDVRQVELSMGNNSVLLPAMLDSGNLLRDPVTAMPVLVAPMRAMRALFPNAAEICDLHELPQGFRLLNVRTAAGGALLPLFRPDSCRLYLDGQCCETQLLVAVAGREYAGVQALVPLAALPPK